jgi:hypothetical protein
MVSGDGPVIIYLAGPYSNDAPIDRSRDASAGKRVARFNAVTDVARQLIEQSEIVFSPLTMTHPIDLRMKHNPGSSFWITFDEAFMEQCQRLIVLKLPGWDASSGVDREIQFFHENGIEPEWIEPHTFGIVAENPDFADAFR